MAEARSEEEEESMRRETREQVVRRQPDSSGGRPDRRKPEHRHSQGPLSSLRAAIKRTSTRPTSLLETPRERERERERDSDRDRDRDRDRRRPQITILSAEPLASTSWFPGAAGGFPPPPPPAAQIWGPTIPPAIKPPPSYEEVIREKTQEQVLLPPSSSSSSSHPVPTVTISTQTDVGPSSDPQDSQERRPVRPPRLPLPYPPKSSNVEDIATTACRSELASTDTAVPHAHSATVAHTSTHTSTHTQCCELLTELCSPLTSTCSAQTDQWDQPPAHAATPLTTSPPVPLERPTPRPRSKLGVQGNGSLVKVQTLVKLREDGLATLAKRAESVSTDQERSQGKYLQELLEAFSSDDWGFPDHRSDNSELSQSESEEGEEEEDMATLRARIQAFEQQQQAADGSCGDANRQTRAGEELVVPQKPEPRPRPRLQGQPAKSSPPVIAPKPKNISAGPKPSSKVFWEDGGLTTAAAEPSSAEATETSSGDSKLSEPSESSTTKPAPSLEVQPSRTSENPSLLPKPQSVRETVSSITPVPAPRPPPPKFPPSLSSTASPPNQRPPPRPPVAPRASVGAPHQDPTTVEVGSGAQTKTQAGSEPTQNTATQTVKDGSLRPVLPTKPAAPTSRRASAPNLAPKPITVSQTPPEPNPAPTKPTPVITPKLPGPAPAKPPSPAPAVRKSPLGHTKSETTNPSSSDPPLPPRPLSVKLLPLRPPPIKSTPGRPPPPAINSSSSSQMAPVKVTPTPPVSAKTSSSPSSVSANQMQAQRTAKKGPPLPPRPKPGHPLYTSYMKQEVLIVLDDPSPAPSVEGKGQTTITPLINASQSLLDMETQPEHVQKEDSQSKPALEGLSLSDLQSILPEQPVEHKEQPDPRPISGPRCIAVFDYEGEEEDELTFSQGDVIALIEVIGQEWGRGQIHGRIGIFPLNFTEVVEPLPQPATSPGETAKPVSAETAVTESSALKSSQAPDSDTEEWVVALFHFPGQTAEDLSFHKGALIQVTEHIDAEWRRGKLEGREGIYPAAFTQPYRAQPVTGQQAVKGTARAVFDFTAENEDELTLKVGDVVTQVECVDEQWILGVVGGKRGIAPKNYISFL